MLGKRVDSIFYGAYHEAKKSGEYIQEICDTSSWRHLFCDPSVYCDYNAQQYF